MSGENISAIMKKPVLAVSMGDPAGIGPEIIVKALCGDAASVADCIIVGNEYILQQAIEITGSPLKLHIISSPEQAVFALGTAEVISLDNIDPHEFSFGQISAMCGKAAYEYIEKCISLAMQGAVDAVVTAPINKESLHAAKVPYIGHTEIFGALTGTPDPLTLFETLGLRVFFFTRHLSLRNMLDTIKKDALKEFAWKCKDALTRLGITHGTMAMAGLNPHCGEHGLFGDEEVNEIIPAVKELQQEGLDIQGPIGADSVFHQAASGKYSCVLSLYHDQGHIATKTLDFYRTISVTAGMPILRTSVDHGTAFDIAGKNIADSTSMTEAIQVAARYAPFYQ